MRQSGADRADGGRLRQSGRGAMLAGMVSLLLAAGPAASQAPTGAEAAAPEPVLRQLEAFRRDDYDAAFRFASEVIREQFGREAFEEMVKVGYPEIAHSVSAVVAETQLAPDGHAYVRLHIRGVNGRSIEAVYEMVWEGGEWHVNGVVARPDPAAAAAGRRAASTGER